jgi:hypothetical protein
VSKAKKKSNKKQSNQESPLRAEPWITMRSGLIIMAITSIGMTVLTAFQAVPAKGWLEGLLWSVLFGASIWIIFFGMIFLNRFFRR